MKRVLRLSTVILLFSGCGENTAYKVRLDDPELVNQSMQRLTDVIVHDIFSPPVASRIYAYASIAGYEAARQGMPDKYLSFAGQVTDLKKIPAPGNENIDFRLAGIHAFLEVGSALIFSETPMIEYQEKIYRRLDEEGLPGSVKRNSISYGDQVARHVLAWADEDMYDQTRTYPKYTVPEDSFSWKPTPPDYMDGIEPHWDKIRPMALDSAGQFPPIPPLKLSMDKSGEFFAQLKEVYDVTRGMDREQTDIAKFWDCNPYVSQHLGHAMYAVKKITPGGHWIGIVVIANRMKQSSFETSMAAYAFTSVALFDGFISCWAEKWRTIVIRPETLINQYMDEEWQPLLQTPPFPEYTSGHSVISRAAAVALTDFYGPDFYFKDTTEVAYGLPAREFNSFLEASEEAAISRLYGGIHYRMAIENGVAQGEEIGKWVVSRLQIKPSK